MIERGTKWRQGALLSSESCHKLGIFETESKGGHAIVITHDCDIPNDKEKFVELLTGNNIDQANSNYTAAKNIRLLHIRYDCIETSQEFIIELDRSLVRVDKNEFSSLAVQNENFQLSSDEKTMLKQWLAARYSRPAFPDEFQSRFNKKKFEKIMIKEFKPVNNYLVGVFFELGDERYSELSPGSPYNLIIYIVYDTVQGSEAREKAENCAVNLKEKFYESFGCLDTAEDIQLENCLAIADINFSLADMRRTDQWRLDYLSFRESPASPHVPL